MDRTVLDAWVGIFVVVGIAALFILALKVSNSGTTFSTGETYRITAEFDNIGGLKVRAPVKSSGVVVGRVSEIQFDSKKFVARVILTLDKRYEFPKDTSVSILTSGLLGEQYIGLEAGGDTAMLKDGDSLKLTQSAVVLEKLIGQFLYNKAAEGGTTK
ncbi:MAG: outer membrane lipid asymmetry maintenance protein MlaD [Betaproteobacteria bacterium]|nr:outer membrane lipid asymmetry maintenance protein MlaD [Betaproteobacteria bacterium]